MARKPRYKRWPDHDSMDLTIYRSNEGGKSIELTCNLMSDEKALIDRVTLSVVRRFRVSVAKHAGHWHRDQSGRWV